MLDKILNSADSSDDDESDSALSKDDSFYSSSPKRATHRRKRSAKDVMDIDLTLSISIEDTGKKPSLKSKPRSIENDEGARVPWQALLENRDSGRICGGSIINMLFVMTSAKCMERLTLKGDGRSGEEEKGFVADLESLSGIVRSVFRTTN